MLQSTFYAYKNSFRGLSKEVWWLALITFINRAGTMVLPFLTLYLNKHLHFTLSEVGWIMSIFGIGSLVGSYLGGKLTDKIGFYQVMFWSLFISGLMLIALQFITSFWGFGIGIFLTMMIADTFRPAMFVAVKAYSKPENQTRTLTLVRLAINLGFTIGPFLGGIIIALISYKGLFWVDGLTCIIAILVFRRVLKNKSISKKSVIADSEIIPVSVLKDKPFWVFLVIVFIMAVIFFQLFTTLPIFYRDIYGLTELQIGLLMALNGGVIFIFEMPLIHQLERSSIERVRLIMIGLLLFSVSFFMLITTQWIGILIISMLVISFGEMLGFPFTNSFAISRAPKGKEGKFMALYTMAFSLAHIFSAKFGMLITDLYGFNTNWVLMGILGLIAVILTFWLKKLISVN
ncbi:MAG TPA: MFS transporter [Flavobacteriaceae bacterium]|nr:MFS transporter [Flavobacteriaceae bacterium]